MNKTGIALIALFILLCAEMSAFAKPAAAPGGTEVDGSFAFATGPGSFDAGWGVNFGAGYMLSSLVKNLEARVDFSFYRFDADSPFGGGSTGLSYTRVPITVSGRYYLPAADKLKLFGQLGVETSFDHFDYISGGNKLSKSEVNVGPSPGAGMEFSVGKNAALFVLGRAHFVANNYFSMQFGFASHF